MSVCFSVDRTAALKAVLSHAPHMDQLLHLLFLIRILHCWVGGSVTQPPHFCCLIEQRVYQSGLCFQNDMPWFVNDWLNNLLINILYVGLWESRFIWQTLVKSCLTIFNAGITSKNIRSNHAPFQWLGCWVV